MYLYFLPIDSSITCIMVSNRTIVITTSKSFCFLSQCVASKLQMIHCIKITNYNLTESNIVHEPPTLTATTLLVSSNHASLQTSDRSVSIYHTEQSSSGCKDLMLLSSYNTESLFGAQMQIDYLLLFSLPPGMLSGIGAMF